MEISENQCLHLLYADACMAVNQQFENSNLYIYMVRLEPIMLKILPIILSRIFQKIILLFFLLFSYPAYYSIIILIQYNYIYIYICG